jgi:hypothetical protein
MRKLLTVLGILVVLLVVAVIFIATHEFDSPDLGRAVLGKVSQATGVNITAKQFKLRLLSGLVLEGVEASSRNDERQLTFALDRLVFEHRLPPLLQGQIAIDKVLFERPKIDVVEFAQTADEKAAPAPQGGSASAPPPTAKPPAQASVQPEAPAAADDPRLSLELRELTIQDGHVAMSRAGESRGVTLDGLTLTMSDVALNPTGKALSSLSGRGEIRLASGTLDKLAFKDAQTRFELKDARFDMPELALVTDYGRLTSKTNVDFNERPFVYHMEARGDGIDLNKMLSSPGGLGGATVNVTADGQGPSSAAVKAKGTVKLASGKLPAIPALLGIDRALSKSVLVERPYQATDLSFTLAKDVLTLAPFHVEVERARLGLDGTAALAGALDMDVALATPIEGIRIDGVASHVLQTLADAQGWISIPISITGTMEQPRIRPDGGALMAQTKQGIKREAKELATDAATRAKQKAGEALKRSLDRRTPR